MPQDEAEACELPRNYRVSEAELARELPGPTTKRVHPLPMLEGIEHANDEER